MLKRRRTIATRARESSDSFSDLERGKKIDRDSVSKEFNETIKTIKKFADHGNLPQIYDPLKSCFEVLKPFHLSDLDITSELETFHIDFSQDGDMDQKCRTGSGDDRKTQEVFIPRLKLKQKPESDVTDSDFETQIASIAKSSSGTSKKNSKSPKNVSKRSNFTENQMDNAGDTSFEYRFLSSEEKTSSDDDLQSDEYANKISGRSVKTLRSPKGITPRPEQGDSLKTSPKKRKKNVFASSSSDSSPEEAMPSPQGGSLSDSQVTQELRLADQRATRTVKMIDQIRAAIAAYQEKDSMTDQENRELKRNQHKLSKNLQQLEKITSRVKHLVGLADKSFKKKWEEIEKSERSQMEEDLQAGGDAAPIPEPAKEEEVKAKEIIPKVEPIGSKREKEKKEEPSPRRSVKNDSNTCLFKAAAVEKELEKEKEKEKESEREREKEKEKEKGKQIEQKLQDEEEPEIVEIETPRTKLKNDLKKLADEISADYDESEMETADEVDSQDLSGTARDKLDTFSPETTGRKPITHHTLESVHDLVKNELKIDQVKLDDFRNQIILNPETIERKLSKILLCEGKGSPNLPSVTAPEGLCAFKSPSLPSVESDAKSVPEVMLSLTGRLSESYSMQEKLAAENADLEGLRYQLQEELITKENAVELLQRKVANLQAEMRLIVRENAQLNDRLIGQGMNPGCEDKITVKVTPPTTDDIVDMKLEEFRETTHTLESTVGTLECEVKRIQQELIAVQKDRQELENHRKMMKININVQRRGMGTHGGLINPLPPRDSNTELQVREMKEQYDRLQQDFNNKLLEVASLRAQNDKLMEITDKAREERDFTEEQCKSLEKRLKQLEGEKTKMLGSKEQLFEQEQQMSVIKLRFREAQDEIDELRNQLDDQSAQLDDYRNKYLQAQQQVEEQIRQIDHMELENQRVREEQNAEINRVKQCFQEKLSELSPLPDILKETQLKLQEAQQLRMIAERNLEDIQRELQDTKERSNTLLRRIESERSTQQLGLDERSQMASRLESWEKKCNELRDENAKLKTTVARLEEASAQNEKRLDEKLHEVAQFSNQLETLREESARQVARCKDRNETVKRSLQNQIADLERQLAQARATARTAQKDKDEIRQRMQTQINNLNDNFEQAQLRIKSLQSHVNFLKNSYSGMFTPEPSNMSLVDSTSAFLIEPPCNPCDCSY